MIDKNTKGIIFNKEFQELGVSKKSLDLVETLEEAITGISCIKHLIGPILRKYNFEGLGKEDEIEFKLHLDLAVKALEKQVPKQVILLYKVNDYDFGECPTCGHSGLSKKAHICCWWCGQKLDWRKNNA